jgi:hypothetical protein
LRAVVVPRDDEGSVGKRRDGGIELVVARGGVDLELRADGTAVVENAGADCHSEVASGSARVGPRHDEVSVGERCNGGEDLTALRDIVDQEFVAPLTVRIEHPGADGRR